MKSCAHLKSLTENPLEMAANLTKSDVWRKNAQVISGRLKRSSKPISSAPVSPKIPHPKKSSFKNGWRSIDGRRIYFRSRWEANFGRYLQWQKENGQIVEWLHEPQTFWFTGIKRGVVSYLPDFKVTTLSGSHEWHEVKGYMDAKSKTKISRFRKYFPKEVLRVFDAKWYKQNSKKLSLIVPGWEKDI